MRSSYYSVLGSPDYGSSKKSGRCRGRKSPLCSMVLGSSLGKIFARASLRSGIWNKLTKTARSSCWVSRLLGNLAFALFHIEIKLSATPFFHSLHHFNCADTRDRLYGVLSLLRDDQGYPVAVDYKRSAETVFEEFQASRAQGTRSLAVPILLSGSAEWMGCTLVGAI